MADNRPGKKASIREVYDYAQALLRSGDSDGWIEMFAQDGVMEVPLALPGMRNHFQGRDAIREYVKPIQQMALHDLTITTTDEHFHDAGDTLIHEFVSNMEDGSGETYRAPYVHVVTIRNGEYVSFRDYASFQMMPPSTMPTVWENIGTTTG